VKDRNFSFYYKDNIEYIKETYREVVFVDASRDEKIPLDADMVIIGGGYVETTQSYDRIKNSHNFRNSLVNHASKNKSIYAECAGLIYLGNRIDDKKMSCILDIDFKMNKTRSRLGYYEGVEYATNHTIKGHAFHYSDVVKAPRGSMGLYKQDPANIKDAGWYKENIKGTYLHTIWRLHPNLV